MAKRAKLGDLVEKIAKPIAKAIDKVAGTDIENCKSCKERKKALNKLDDKLSGANTASLTADNLTDEEITLLKKYDADSGVYMNKRTQMLYLDIIKKYEKMRYSTTSCAKCWLNNQHGHLLRIKERNNIK